MKKTFTVVLTAAVVASAFWAVPAEAKKKKPKPKPGCAAFVPGDEGAEAESFKVTDANTAEAPLEITITQGPGAVAEVSDAFANIQIDSAAAEAGLYVRYEMPVYEDHDLYINYSDGTEAAHVGGFNPAPVVPGQTDGTGTGGHSEQGAEQIDGLRTADCAGYTAKFTNYLGEGGDYTVKVWLGEIQNDPA